MPQRIVSLNLCTDELLLRLAPKERIASITWLGKDTRSSSVAALARDIPVNHGLAEEVIGFDPDLVLANAWSARATVDFLRRQGVRVLDLGIPESMDEVRGQIREVAATLGETSRGEALVAEMDARLAKVTSASSARPKAVMLGPNGFAASHSPLMNEMFALAGLESLAATLGAPDRAGIPLESVLLAGADILAVEENDGESPALAQELLRHPAIAALRERAHVVELPARLWACAGPQLAEAILLLAKARAALEEK